MPKVIFEGFETPSMCGECRHISNYTGYPYSRDPHSCCELIWQITEGNYRVDPNSIDERCPYKNGYFEF